MSELRKNINEIVAALERLKNNNGNFKTDDEGLFNESRLVFEKLKILSDFDPDDIEKVIDVLDKLPAEVRELKIEELGMEAEKLDSKALDKEDLKQLVEDYEKATGDEQERIHQEIYKRTGERDVKHFIERQKEIVAKNAKKLDELDADLKEKVVADLAKIDDEKIEMACLDDKFDKKDFEKEIKRGIKEKEEVEKIVREVERVRAEIEVETKAEEIAQKTFEKLKTENLPVTEKVKAELKAEILKAWKVGDELKIPAQLVGKDNGETIVREAQKATEKFKAEYLREVVNYRAIELEKKISFDLRDSGVRDEALIEQYVSVINELTNNPETARAEINTREVVTSIESRHEANYKFATQPEIAVEEAQFMAKNVIMSSKKFENTIKKYNNFKDQINSLINPSKNLEKNKLVPKIDDIKEIRVLNKMANLFKDSKMMGLMNGAQNMVGLIERVNAFPNSVLARIGLQKMGMQVLGKIGGQAAVDLVTNAAAVIAEQGTVQGVKSIATALLSGGAVTAGEGAAAGGSLAGVVAAFQALPVVGQVVAVVVLVIVGTVVILKPLFDIFNGVKNKLGNLLNIDANGVKHFIADSLGLGNVVGAIGQFGFDAATILIGIPAAIGLIVFTRIIASVVICFFLGTFVYSMFQQNMVSSIVPPADSGNCVLKKGSETGNIPLPGNAEEVPDSEGRIWICTPNTQLPAGDYDPNSPGLDGVAVDGECSVGDAVVMTKQCDPKWGSIQLRGENCTNGQRGTICSAGCGPTSVSMMMRRVNGSMTPNNVIFGAGSAYAGMGCNGSDLGQAKTELVKKFGSAAVTLDNVTLGCDEKAIAKWICDGKVVMVLANFYRNSSLSLGGHFVLAIGVRNGKIVVADPYYSATDTPFDGTRAYGYAHDIIGCLTVDKGAIR